MSDSDFRSAPKASAVPRPPSPAASKPAGPIEDGKAFLKQALETLQASIDKILGDASAEIPTLTDDAKAYINSFIDQRAPAIVRPFIDSILNSVEGTFTGQVDAKASFFLHLFKTDIDSALNHLESDLS